MFFYLLIRFAFAVDARCLLINAPLFCRALVFILLFHVHAGKEAHQIFRIIVVVKRNIRYTRSDHQRPMSKNGSFIVHGVLMFYAISQKIFVVQLFFSQCEFSCMCRHAICFAFDKPNQQESKHFSLNFFFDTGDHCISKHMKRIIENF